MATRMNALGSIPMKLFALTIVAMIISHTAGRCEPKPPAATELKSLHGTMITMISEDKGHLAEIWAKGDNVRAEFSNDKHKIITLQLGDTLYTFGTDSKKGTKQRFASGLASMGLIKQIATIKSKGKKESTREIDGITYEEYSYEESPEASTDVWLEAKTSVPSIWLSAMKTSDKTLGVMRMRYRDMKANVEIADELFKLPTDVTFSEVTDAVDPKDSKRSPTATPQDK
jgi:outer membrane lipoprotein-sorting protein